MTFEVDPFQVEAYANEFRHLEIAATYASEYMLRYGSFDWHESGVLGILLQEHAKIAEEVGKRLIRLEVITEGSQVALSRIAASYQTTDEKSAAALDAILPPSPRPTASTD